MSATPEGLPRNQRTLQIFCLLALAGLWIHFAEALPATYVVQLNDFPAYYSGAMVVAQGEPERLYGTEFKWFTNLPVVSVLLAPLSLLAYPDAWRLFWWIQVASYVATFALLLYGIRRHFGPLTPPRALLAGAIFLAFAPVLRRCLALGQTTPMMVLLFALLWLVYRESWPRVTGGLLGFICVVKIPPMLLLPLLALRRRLDVAAVAAAVLLAGVAISWVVFGSEQMGQYADRVIWDNFGRSQAAFNNRSLDGFFMRAFSDKGLADWVPVPRPPLVTAGVLGVALALGVLLLRSGRGFLWPARAPRDDDPYTGSLELEIALGVVLMVLLFPVVWIHYYLFLAVPLTLLPFWWQQRGLPRTPWLIALLVAGTWLASGSESYANAYYAAHEHELRFRLALNAQTLGALLLAVGLAFPLAEMSRRSGAQRQLNQPEGEEQPAAGLRD
jgi:hypothetical protein